MAVNEVQCSLRIEDSLRDEVKLVSKHLNISMNQLITDAIRYYLPEKRAQIEDKLTESLRLLKEYSQRDPNYEKAIQQFAAAEVSDMNPIEGKFYDVREQSETSASTELEISAKTEMLENFLADG